MKKLFKNLFFALLVSIGLFLLVDFGIQWYTKHGETVVVPSLVGKTKSEAIQLITDANLVPIIQDSVYSDSFPKLAITDQDPDMDRIVKENRKVYLTINSLPKPKVRMPKLIDCYKTVINDYLVKNKEQNELPLFIGGKSMGSRVAATLASDVEMLEHIKGVFCCGYPFHPPKKTDKLRLEPLQKTHKPILIAQGERDTLGSKIEINDRYVFVNRFGFKVIEKSRKDFAYDIQKNKAVPLEATPLFDRAFNSITGNLRSLNSSS